jgi:hypothetical protein
VQLTGTNRSIGLIVLIFSAHFVRERALMAKRKTTPDHSGDKSLLHRSVLCRPGGHSEEPLPDPIPNSAVKVLCADGTKSQGLEE